LCRQTAVAVVRLRVSTPASVHSRCLLGYHREQIPAHEHGRCRRCRPAGERAGRTVAAAASTCTRATELKQRAQARAAASQIQCLAQIQAEAAPPWEGTERICRGRTCIPLAVVLAEPTARVRRPALLPPLPLHVRPRKRAGRASVRHRERGGRASKPPWASHGVRAPPLPCPSHRRD
jgi:hypothetical protein